MKTNNHRTLRKIDYYIYYVIKRNYQQNNIDYGKCDICQKKNKLCVEYTKENKILRVCEKCNYKEVPYKGKRVNLIKLTKQIENKNLRKMVQYFLRKYRNELNIIIPSISGKYHTREKSISDHLSKVFKLSLKAVNEFNLNSDEKDILLASALLHDIANCKNITIKRISNRQKFYKRTGFYRDRFTYVNHPTLSMKLIIDYIAEQNYNEINELMINTAKCISRHMNRYLNKFNEITFTKIDKLLSLCDYLSSR